MHPVMTALTLWTLSLYGLYLAVRFGVQHGIQKATSGRSAEAEPSDNDPES